MVLHKRLDFGFNGYQVPSFPRASRSARGRGLFKRKADDKQICAFDLLATVAENLLEEGEDSQSPSNIEDEKVQPFIVKDFVRQKERDEEKPLKPCNPGNSDDSVFVSDFTLLGHNQSKSFKGPRHPKYGMGLEHNSIIAKSSDSEKFDHAEVVAGQKRNGFVKLSSEIEGGSLGYGESRGYVVNAMEGQLESETEKQITNVINSTVQDTCSSEVPMELDIKPPTLVSSDSTIEVPHASFLPFQTDVKLVCKDVDEKDDDENSSGCTRLSTRNLKAFRPPPRIGDRRIRRLLASKYWKVAPRLNNRELSNYGMRHVYRNTKACYIRQRPQRNSNFRRRRLFEHRLISRSEEGTHSECISKSSKYNKAASGSASRASLVAAQESSLHSRGSRVKLSIKSFRVPELFIDIPETATVGSLKRTVREAVTAILAGGLCVGVVLQGKKVKDDNKTLLQTGISHDDKLDALGFMLEPKPSPAPTPALQPLYQEDTSILVSCDIAQSLSRYPKTLDGDLVSSDASPNPMLTNVGTFVENGLDAIPTTALTVEEAALDSRTLIASPKSVEALAVIPLNRKSRQSEQRRIRRPFSVSEVEVLVQAVEKLGTGRWRDVKLWAFENANHRTYVDLKDKWKTLVHTARISPQQRRGEPVPQELLDRVLAAHSHWSQHVKQQIKQETSNLIEEGTHSDYCSI